MHGMSTLGSSEFEEYALMSSFKITRGGANPCLARGVFVAYQCFHGQEALTTQEPLLISGFLAIWRTTSFMRAASWNHRFIQCVFHCWINKIIKQLHTMNTQNDCKWVRLPSITRFGVVGAYLFFQSFPWQQRIHLLEEFFLAVFTFFKIILCF